jgi:hypothetical protein
MSLVLGAMVAAFVVAIAIGLTHPHHQMTASRSIALWALMFIGFLVAVIVGASHWVPMHISW